MKSSELRVGNLIKGKSPEKKVYEEPVKIDEYYLTMFFNKMMDVEPIPLTEEWLLKFGFETNDVRYWQISAFRLHINRYGEWIFKVETFEQEIKYVHQLQNLYFDLVGEELKQQEQ
jgi:hypothetical protein